LWPPFVHELVGVKASDVYLRVWAPMFLAAVPFAIVSYAVNEYFPARSVVVFMLQSVAMLPVFVGVIALIYRRSFGTQILPRIRSFMLARRAT
jgi:hypothetical protein